MPLLNGSMVVVVERCGRVKNEIVAAGVLYYIVIVIVIILQQRCQHSHFWRDFPAFTS